jgi:hypothetical protein
MRWVSRHFPIVSCNNAQVLLLLFYAQNSKKKERELRKDSQIRIISEDST